MTNKRILILGGGRGQVGLIRTAKSMGITTIVATGGDGYPGLPLADEICYVDISSPESVLEKAENLNIDGIATACMDTGIKALGFTCENMGIIGLSKQAAYISNDKMLMKEAFMKNGVSTARFYHVDNEASFKSAIDQLCLPVIVKAVDLQGSRGIYIAHTYDEAIKGFYATMNETSKDYCIVEEYIEGEEFGAQAFVYHGEVIFVLPHGDNTYMSNTAVPIGHYAPYVADEDIHNQTQTVVRDAIKAIGLDNCAVNVDLIIRNHKVYVIEITGRVGANCLPELVSIYFGIDYYKMIILTALGADPRHVYDSRELIVTPNASRMLFSMQSGKLLDIVNDNDQYDSEIEEITFFVKKGDDIRKFMNSNDCLAQVIVKSDSLSSCFEKIEEIKEKIHFNLS